MTHDEAVQVTTQEDADAAFAELVDECIRVRKERGEPHSRDLCEAMQRQNLGYYSGYFGLEVQKRVESLYKTVHPIFGSTNDPESRKPENAIRLGYEWGAKARK